MRRIDIIAAFELEINKIDDVVNKPVTDDSLYWLNQAILKFVKIRFNKDFVHGTSYEQTEKRARDLITLYSTKTYNKFLYSEHATYDKYSIEYPEDFMFYLNEDVEISNLDGEYKTDTCVFECTSDNFMYRINNSLTDFHYRYHKARPLRIRTNDGCSLLTDKNYKINKYILGYIRTPKELTLQYPTEEYSEFPDYILQEIIKIAAQMYIENKQDARYQTISAEVNMQE